MAAARLQLVIITSAKEDMFHPAFVCLFVCLLAGKLEKLLTNFDEIFGGIQCVTSKK